MNRRDFINPLPSVALGRGALASASGCMALLISAAARDKSAGDPWQCMNCGHLTPAPWKTCPVSLAPAAPAECLNGSAMQQWPKP